MTLLDELADTTRSVAVAVNDAVVSVGRGSGVVVEDGLVVTCAHNLPGDTAELVTADGRRLQAAVLGADLDGDLAVLHVDALGIRPLERSAATTEAGDVVFAAANPYGQGVRVTSGQITATDRSFRGPRGQRNTGALEHTAPLLRGSSGGAVVDHRGGLLAINTHRLDGGFYVAVPVDEAWWRRMESLRAGSYRPRQRLGVAVLSPRTGRRIRAAAGLPERDGLLVRSAHEDGPAARAGIEAGDLLVACGDTPLATVDDLHDALASAGDTLSLTVVRGVEERSVEVHFGDE
jgi:serine protease Do